MAELRTLVSKVRSKNAGPFWLTIDIFCGSPEAYARVVDDLSTQQIAAVFQADSQTVKRFDMPDLNVVKFSLPRPTVQGAIGDRDMHGASWAALVGELDI
ncbi:DUF4387 family protein [Roseobacter sp. A03A-229]